MMSVGDVVRYVPGVSVHQGENNRDQVIIRGNGSSADFFIDGVRDDVRDYRDLYNVERVEALKGPNAMIFGRGGAGAIRRVEEDVHRHVPVSPQFYFHTQLWPAIYTYQLTLHMFILPNSQVYCLCLVVSEPDELCATISPGCSPKCDNCPRSHTMPAATCILGMLLSCLYSIG